MGTEPHCPFFRLRLRPPHPRRLAPLSDIGGVLPLPQETKNAGSGDPGPAYSGPAHPGSADTVPADAGTADADADGDSTWPTILGPITQIDLRTGNASNGSPGG